MINDGGSVLKQVGNQDHHHTPLPQQPMPLPMANAIITDAEAATPSHLQAWE